MKPPRARPLAALALAAAVAVAGAALAQDSRPESLLPPGFGDPAPPLPPAPPPGSDAPVQAGATQAVPEGEAVAPILPVEAEVPATPDELAAAEEAAQADELPPDARRPIDEVGALAVANGGFEANAFGAADGRFITGLMRRLDAPIASRWASMLLRRALMSATPAPSHIQPADWIAGRAALLLRMGEADGARMLVQLVDGDRYSGRLFDVALNTAMATSDPVALCAIADRGAATGRAAEWPLAQAICAGLAGDSAKSGAILDKAREERTASGIDLLLAEKLSAAGTNDRRAIGITWRSVKRLTPWRFGMGSAAGVAIPEPLLAGAGPAMLAWAARTPTIPYARRIDPARTAAVLGVFSSAALVDLYATLGDDADPTATEDTPTGRLRTAYVGDGPAARMAALRALWADPPTPADRYANAILTARAAARIAPDEDFTGDIGDLAMAMLSAGLDGQAAGWARLVPSGSGGDLAFALLSVAAPRPVIAVDPKRIEGMENRLRAQLLFAGLVGLGRVTATDEMAQALGVPLGHSDGWTRAIDRAAELNQSGTVALLAAVGLQSGGWGGVPPVYLLHIVRALAATGHEAEARMIAAEALSRTA